MGSDGPLAPSATLGAAMDNQRSTGAAADARPSRSPRLHVLQVISDLTNPAAGPTYSATRLAESIAAAGADSSLYCTGPVPAPPDPSVHLHQFPTPFQSVPVAGALRHAPALAQALIADAALPGTVLHSHGLWLMPNIYPADAAARTGAPLVLSPRGMLSPGALQFSKAKKQIFGALFQRRALHRVACFHATAAVELEDIRRAGLKAPVAIIPNGIDIPPLSPSRPRRRTVLYLGRVHPKKGIDRLLTAWRQVETHHPEVTLRVVGPSEGGHIGTLKALKAQLGLTSVTFEEGLYGAEKQRAFEDATLFVLPTLSENFGMVVAEALAAACPVICTKGAPWQGLDTHECGWWIDHGPDAMAAALRNALSLSADDLAQKGLSGRAWMQKDFSWTKIGEDMVSVYEWLLNRRERPTCVSLPSMEA
ncbi:hypothetical protein PB2503_11319 [Parvularcula bermudensis HTCC2503]|uniref:Glycosyltransferase n=1 Tax=Parvularcula bermudensis (strain ATCC BAA-594 / HTCC2503 / KCTC 12087) TaxID=314260 RepID=E0TC53_PARBH|nr:glycosyltransferase [Parvularcula bermudensis]ADM10311.1 hypothetical protein PB2503_11319 [Parvularcula bermudensis HTCC2503]